MADSGLVVVIGSGPVGLSVAYELARGGADVAIVDRAAVGSGAARRNAGWVTPILSAPVPAPGVIATSLKWMLDAESPLRVAPDLSLGHVAFMLRMLAASTPTRFARGLAAVGELGRGTLELFREYRAAGVEFEMHDDGVLLVFRSADERDHHAHDLAESARFGSADLVPLSGADLRDLEPTLSDHADAGLLSPDQAYLSPSTFVDGLAARLKAMGVPLLTEQVPVAVRRRRDHVEVLAGRRILGAHRVVIAAGVGSASLTASLGCRIPLRFGKGYGFDLPLPPVRPRRAIYLAAERVAVTPLDSGLRLAGTMEFGGDPEALDLRRAAAIVASSRPYFRGDLGPAPRPWSGLRPMLPDGLPAIGELPGCPAAILATGHAMLGVTLAPRTGRLVRELVLTGRTPDVLTPFDPGRFRIPRPR